MQEITVAFESLGELKRPRSFSDIVGHHEAIEFMADEIRSGFGRSVLLFGPTGCGKTTIAEVYAKALLCEGLEQKPCAEESACTSCVNFETGRAPRLSRVDQRGHQNFRNVVCRDKHDGATIKELGADISSESLSGGRKVILIDDLQHLSQQGFDDLHFRLERPPAKKTFVMCASELDAVPQRVRSHCPTFHIAPLPVPLRLEVLRRIAASKGIECEHEALKMMAEYAASDTRSLIRDFEVVSRGGEVTAKHVSRYYRLNIVKPVEQYLRALSRSDSFIEQVHIINAWRVEPNTKIEAIERHLTTLMQTHVFGLDLEGKPSSETSGDHSIARELNRRAESSSFTVKRYWYNLVAHWRPVGLATEATLWAKLCAFDDMVNGRSNAAENAPGPENGSAKGKVVSKSSGHASASVGRVRLRTAREGSLPVGKALDLWEAASFMVQKYGVLLNTHILLRHDELGTGEQAAATISSLTRELRRRLRPSAPKGRRSALAVDAASDPDAFHWLFGHEHTEAFGFCTHLIAHVPPSARDLDGWVRNVFLRSQTGSSHDRRAARVRRLASSSSMELWYHIQLVRLLCRGVDPAVSIYVSTQSGKKAASVADLLGIDHRCRGFVVQSPKPTKPCGWSESIGAEARKKERLNRFASLSLREVNTEEAWRQAASGWELVEHEHRQRETVEREAEMRKIEERWPAGVDPETDDGREMALANLRKSWPEDALSRLRSPGWWTELYAANRANLGRKTTRGRRS